MLRPLIILLAFAAGAMALCEESDQIMCGTNDRCVRLSYICDGDNDCGDYTDENDEICSLWRQEECSRGSAFCRRSGFSTCLDVKQYCLSDPPCEGSFDPRLCQMVRNGKIQRLEDIIMPRDRRESQDGGEPVSKNLEETMQTGKDFDHLLTSTISHDDCPALFTKVGDMCLSLFSVGNMTWGEAEQFCKVIGGTLFAPKKSSEIYTITHHIRSHPITTDFWIGGHFYNNTMGWRWINGDPMELHTNQWAIEYDSSCYRRDVHWEYRNVTEEANNGVCYNYHQAPYLSNPEGSCVAATYKRFYFFSDENCNMRKSPLCRSSK